MCAHTEAYIISESRRNGGRGVETELIMCDADSEGMNEWVGCVGGRRNDGEGKSSAVKQTEGTRERADRAETQYINFSMKKDRGKINNAQSKTKYLQ